MKKTIITVVGEDTVGIIAVRRHFHKNAPDLRSRQKGRKITYD